MISTVLATKIWLATKSAFVVQKRQQEIGSQHAIGCEFNSGGKHTPDRATALCRTSLVVCKQQDLVHSCLEQFSRKQIYNDTGQYSQMCSPEDAKEIATTFGWPMSKWDKFNLHNFLDIFYENRDFNEDIGLWNVSNALFMEEMFFEARAINQDILSWDVSTVTSILQLMFCEAENFNQDLLLWITGSVRDMSCMLQKATSFNQDLAQWDTSSVTAIDCMFVLATLFNQDISLWHTSSMTNMSRMFHDSTVFVQSRHSFVGYIKCNINEMYVSTIKIFLGGIHQV
jgi:hypothetical protein